MSNYKQNADIISETFKAAKLEYRKELTLAKTKTLTKQVAKHSLPKDTDDKIVNGAAIGASLVGVGLATAVGSITGTSLAITGALTAAGIFAYNQCSNDKAEALRELTYRRPRRSLLSRLSRWGSEKAK